MLIFDVTTIVGSASVSRASGIPLADQLACRNFGIQTNFKYQRLLSGPTTHFQFLRKGRQRADFDEKVDVGYLRVDLVENDFAIRIIGKCGFRIGSLAELASKFFDQNSDDRLFHQYRPESPVVSPIQG